MLMTQDQTQSTNDRDAARLFGTQNNREILEQLEQERSLVEATFYGIGVVMLTGMALGNPLIATSTVSTLGISLRKSQKLGQLLQLGTAILDAFEGQGVEIGLCRKNSKVGKLNFL